MAARGVGSQTRSANVFNPSFARSLTQVLAYFWDYTSSERMNAVKNIQKNPREIIKMIANNHVVVSSIKDLPRLLRNRQFIIENAWVKQPNSSYIFAARSPTTNEFEDNRLIDIGKNKQRRLVRVSREGLLCFKILTNAAAH